MNKTTVELLRNSNHIHGYGTMISPITEQIILDKLVEWSKANPFSVATCEEIKIYKHMLRVVEENISETDFYNPNFDSSMKIPRCDLVYYLDIYYQ